MGFIDQGCQKPFLTTQLGYGGDPIIPDDADDTTRERIDAAYGPPTEIEVCKLGPYSPSDPILVEWGPRWLDDSLADPEGDFGYENTRVYFQLGEIDTSSAVAHGAAYFKEIIDAAPTGDDFPYARIDCIAGMEHGPDPEEDDVFYQNLRQAITWANTSPPSAHPGETSIDLELDPPPSNQRCVPTS